MGLALAPRDRHEFRVHAVPSKPRRAWSSEARKQAAPQIQSLPSVAHIASIRHHTGGRILRVSALWLCARWRGALQPGDIQIEKSADSADAALAADPAPGK